MPFSASDIFRNHVANPEGVFIRIFRFPVARGRVLVAKLALVKFSASQLTSLRTISLGALGARSPEMSEALAKPLERRLVFQDQVVAARQGNKSGGPGFGGGAPALAGPH